MKLGIEKKEERWKVWVLGLLAVVGAYVMYTNLMPDTGSSSVSSPAPRAKAVEQPAASAALPTPVSPARRRANGRVAGDFRPKLRSERIEDRPDLTKIDPTIKMDLLTRVQNVGMEGGARNIFQFGAAAAPLVPVAIPKVAPIKPGPVVAAKPGPPPPPPGPPPPPMAPPIPFKYYGYSSVKGEPRKRAFFLDGDDIIVAYEGDLIKNRYKVVHVGPLTVDMEDTRFTNNAKQSLRLVEDLAG